MLSFAVTGSIGCVLATAPDELTLAISSTLDRPGEPLRVAWVLCLADDALLRSTILERFREGDVVHIIGEIEQRRRQVGELGFYSVAFIIRSIERLVSPCEGSAS